MKKVLLFVSFLLLCFYSQAQDSSHRVKTVNTHTKARMLGESPAVRSLVPSGSPFASKKKGFKKQRQVPKNFAGRKPFSKATRKELEHQGPDALRQVAQIHTITVDPLINRDGIGDEVSPLDPTGDVGQQYYVQAVNVTEIGVFDKNGDLVAEFALGDLWGPLGALSAGDPIVLYDEIEKRWFLTEFTDPANLLIAVSTSPDPLGSYFVYSFSTPEFPDYPKYGIWPDALLVTTNEGFTDGLTQYFIEKAPLIAGDTEVSIQRIEVPGNANTEAGFFVSTPVDIDGIGDLSDPRPIAMKLDDSSWGGTNQDEVDMYRFDIDWDNPDSTFAELSSLSLSPFDGFPCSVLDSTGFDCIPQLGARGLDGIPETIMNVPKLRSFDTHESMVFSFITDVTDGNNLSGIRWVELRKTDSTDWALYQEGTYAPDSLDRFMPSIAIDKLGNIGLGYNVSSPEGFVGIRYTGRLANDTLGQMTVTEYQVAEGQGPIESGGRFGDYAHMSIDPTNGLTFWYTTEYAGDGDFVTESRIVAFELGIDTFDLEAVALRSPLTSPTLGDEETVSLEIHNRGLEALSNIKLGFSVNGSIIETVTFSDTLLPDSTVVFDFPTPVDMELEQSYWVQAFLAHPQDANKLNDTLLQEVIHLAELDAAISLTPQPSTCQPSTTLPVLLTNGGASTLESGEFEVRLNGNPVDTVSWKGRILFGESVVVTLPINSLQPDTNQIVITFFDANEEVESTIFNNTDSLLLIFDPTQTEYILELTTDDFPSETIWQIADEMGTVLASGGPYSEPANLETESICLEDSGCFVFSIFDSAEDGICCDFGEGSYSLIGPNGDTIFESTGQFTDSETQNFCSDSSTKPCLLSTEVIISPDTSSDLVDILIEVEGGEGPFIYSIDAGATFQNEAVFAGISQGSYVLVVQDSTGTCSLTDTIQVDILTSIQTLGHNSYSFSLFPNPNSGYFHIEFSSEKVDQTTLTLEVWDAQGRIIQKRDVSSYNGIFKAPISLIAYPSGHYFIRLLGREFQVAKRVLVQ